MSEPKTENELRENIASQIKELSKANDQLDSETINELMNSICVKNLKVCCFKYITIKQKLSKTVYQSILKILDFDPYKSADWDDQECGNDHKCHPNFGYACDQVRCET